MPVLSNPKHERFAQELARGKTADEAYRLAGFKPNRGNAATLKAKQSISDRVRELQERVAERVVEKTALTKEWVLESLRENYERAMQQKRARNDDGEEVGDFTYQGNVANRALELIGKEIGMFVDRKEVGKPGDFAGMTDDELNNRIGELVSRGKTGAGPVAGGAGSPPVQKRMPKPH
jgi:phage terminase small subunit